MKNLAFSHQILKKSETLINNLDEIYSNGIFSQHNLTDLQTELWKKGLYLSAYLYDKIKLKELPDMSLQLKFLFTEGKLNLGALLEMKYNTLSHQIN